MADEAAEPVPIRPGVRAQQPRSLALLEFVCQALATFEDREEPEGIAFVIYGKDGLTKTGWMTDEGIGEMGLCAVAGALLAAQAAQFHD
jgi:hypothetical protein